MRAFIASLALVSLLSTRRSAADLTGPGLNIQPARLNEGALPELRNDAEESDPGAPDQELPSNAGRVVVPPPVLIFDDLSLLKGQHGEGWGGWLSVAGGFAFSQSSSVVGNEDGVTIQLNAVVNGAIHYTRRTHEWITQLTLRHAQSKSPALSTWVKTQDELNGSLLYLYGFPKLDWLGPFARLRLQSTILPGLFLSENESRLRLHHEDRRADIVALGPEEPFQLTGSFNPLVTRESAGLFARPLNTDRRWLILSAGLGYQQIYSDGGWALNDQESSPEIDLWPLNDTTQVGLELGIEAAGAWHQLIGWSGQISLLYPVLGDGETNERSAAGLNSELAAQLSLKLSEWFSLDYRLSGRRIPLLVDDWQLFHGLLLTSSFALLGSPPREAKRPPLRRRDLKPPGELPRLRRELVDPSSESEADRSESSGSYFIDLLFGIEERGQERQE